jgi:hypothetical protein
MPARETSSGRLFSAAAILISIALFGVSVYRAATQSITIDEAFSYLDFLARPNFWRFEFFDAALHVLYAMAARLSTGVFGLSELSYRLPALAGAVLLLAGLFLVSRRLFGATIWLPVAVLLCGLNPLLLDFMSAARGYGLGLGFWVLALYFALPPSGARALAFSSACMGLAVAAQLTYAVPSAALALVIALPLLIRGPRLRLLPLVLPGPAIAAAILAWPMRHATASSFYIGVRSWPNAFDSISRASLFRDPLWWNARLGWFLDLDRMTAAFAILLLVYAAVSLRRRYAGPATITVVATLAGVLALTPLLAIFIPNPYPVHRAGLYLIPLVSLAWLAMTRDLRRRPASAAGLAAAALCIGQYILEFHPGYYDVYRDSAGVKKIFNAIRTSAGDPARIGASSSLANSLNFYLRMYPGANIEPVEHRGPDCYFDYYALLPADQNIVKRYDLELLYRDPISRAALYRPSEAALARLAARYPPPVESSPRCGCEPGHDTPCPVRDVDPQPGPHWARRRPALLFRLDPQRATRLRISLYAARGVPAPRFHLTVLVNGERIAATDLDSGAMHDLEFPVPPGLIAKRPFTSVELVPDPVLVDDWGDVLSFVLNRVAFLKD